MPGRVVHTLFRTLWMGTLLLAGGGVGCAGVPAAFGPTREQARANADGIFGSFAERFTNVYRTARYEHAREKLGRYALTPSVIYNDTSVWTAIGPDGTRTLFGEATVQSNRYVFTNAPSSTPLKIRAEGRHVMRLHKLGNSQYEWFTGVDFAAGSITANDAANVITGWLAAAEGHSGAEVRADMRRAYPRTSEAMGKLFSLDTLISVRDRDGGNTVYLGIRITPDGIRPTLPNYAAYLDKYVKHTRLRFTLTDRRGAPWVAGALSDGYLTFRVRSHDGHFAPLEGPVAPIPDTLVIHADFTAKVALFTVGFSKLVGEWVNVGSEHERGWALRFTREPDWQLPPTFGFFLRSPLRRPFQGAGTWFRIVVHDAPGEQTLLSRRGTTTVQESAVLRFLGKLGGKVLGDFVATAEEEENRFDATVFTALREDTDALLGR